MADPPGAHSLRLRKLRLFPIALADGRFWGTLCAIDPKPRTLSAPATIAALEDYAAQVASILSRETAVG